MIRRYSHQFAESLVFVALLAIVLAASTVFPAFAQASTWCQGRSKSRPLWRSKTRPTRLTRR
jgi:hypothetical protein